MRTNSYLLIFALTTIAGACEHPCEEPDTREEIVELCDTHPFGRAPGCGGVEEPQTFDACVKVLVDNPGLCTSGYVKCRDTLREAACDECPRECEGIQGACD